MTRLVDRFACHRMRTSQVGPLLALAAAALLAAGCGGGSDADTKSATATNTAHETPSSHSPTDQASARRALIGLSNLPPRWSNEGRYDEEGLICGSFDPLGSAITRVSSERLHNNYTDVQELIAVFRTERESEAANRALNSKESELCLRRTMRNRILLHSGTDGIGLRIERLKKLLVDDLEPRGREVHYAAVFTSEVGVAKIYVDVVRTQVDRSVAVLLIVSGFTPVDYDSLSRLVRQRLGAVPS